MATTELSSSMVRDITMLMSDATARPKLRRYITKLKKEKLQAEDEVKLKFKAELKADLAEALQELKEEKEGKASFMTMDDLYSELAKQD